LAGPACDYRMRAGERAVSRAAYTEAIANFSLGLSEAEKLPEAAERMRRQLDFTAEAWSGLDGHARPGKRRSRECFSKGCGDECCRRQ